MPSRARPLLLAIALAGCAAGGGRAVPAGYAAQGLASWYGEEMAGRATASGEPFRPGALTAAHRTLPLGSLARVTALATGRSVVVRINDRGPWERERLIDLSRGAAQALAIDRVADKRVRVAALGGSAAPASVAEAPLPPVPPAAAAGALWVQVASFASRDRAQALAARLGAGLQLAGERWRVRLGPYRDAATAARARDAAAARGYGDATILSLPDTAR
jgi:rare lipoprotein A